jgi:hypothetical protein
VGGEARHADPVQTAQPPNRAAFGDSRGAQGTGELAAAGCQDARLRSRLDLYGAGAKTETVFYADDRVLWVVESGQMRVNIEGQQPFVAKKGFLVQAAPRLAYSMQTVDNEPVLHFEVRPAGEMPSYPIDETATPVKGGRSFNRASPTPAPTISTIGRIWIS